MTTPIDWEQARQIAPVIFGPNEEAGDGITPAQGEQSDTVIGLGLASTIIYGEPEEIMELLAAASIAIQTYTENQ